MPLPFVPMPACTATITLTLFSDSVTCFGLCNGKASVIAVGGTPPYTYLWNDPAAQTTAVATGLCSQPGGKYYTVIVKDVDTCISIDSVAVYQPDTLVLSVISVDSSHCGKADGGACVSATGGTQPYSFFWDDPGSTTLSCLANVLAGTYNATVLDTHFCTNTVPATIYEVPGPVITGISTQNDDCYGSCLGSATVNGITGTGPFYLIWKSSAGDTLAQGFCTPPCTLNSLCTGVYSVTAVDSGTGCLTGEVPFGINKPAALSAAVSPINKTDVTCFGQCNGTALVTASGGSPPYTYLWTATGDTTPSIDSLCAGLHQAVVSDVIGCQDTTFVSISQPGPLVLTAAALDARCFNLCNGSISTSVSGGVFPYAYTWSPPGTAGNTSIAVNLCADTNYSVVVADLNGCKDTVSGIIISQPPPLLIVTSVTDAKCFGDCNGSAAAAVTGGVPSYTYSWSNGDKTATADSLCSGDYVLTLTDSNNCTAYDSISVAHPAEVLLSTTFSNSTCVSTCNGKASVAVSGGILPYTFTWNNGDNSENPDSLCPGIYTLTLTDNNGCTKNDTVFINQVTALNVTVSSGSTCPGTCEGTATANASGGVPPYAYSWSNGDGIPAADSLCTGTHGVTVTDSVGCIFTDSAGISENPSMSFSVSGADKVCAGLCNGSLSVTVSGGTPSFAYLWSTTPIQTGPLATGLCSGSYTVSVSDNKGCQDTAQSSITEWPQLLMSYTVDSASSGSSNGAIYLTVTGGNPPYSYIWSNGGPDTSAVTGLKAGDYSVTVSDSAGCQITDSITVPQSSVIGFAALSPENGLRIYPNPSPGKFTVEMSDGDRRTGIISANECEADIYNASGQKVSHVSFILCPPSFTIDISTFPDGLYLLRLSTMGLAKRVLVVKEWDD